jgi:hypothetical protein
MNNTILPAMVRPGRPNPRGLPGLCVQRFAVIQTLSQLRADPPCEGLIVAGNMLYTGVLPPASSMNWYKHMYGKVLKEG